MKRLASLPYLLMFLLMLNNFNYAQNILWEKSVDVNTMKFTPDGNYLVTGGANQIINCYPYTCGQIQVWNVADSTSIVYLENYSLGFTNDLDISSDGERIVSGHGSVYCSAFTGCSKDRAGQFKHNINGTLLNTIAEPGGIVYSIAFSPDKKLIAAGTGYNNTGEIRVYDTDFNLVKILPGHSNKTESLVFTPDGQYLISGGADGRIKFWDYNNGTLVRSLIHGNYTNGGTDITVSVSPDGQFLASGASGYHLNVKIWKISDGTLIHTFDHDNEYGGNAFAEFSPNNFYLATGQALIGSGGLGWHGIIRFYEVFSGNLVREYIDTLGSPTQGGIRALAFSPTGNNLFAYSIGFHNSKKLRLATTDLNLVKNPLPGVDIISLTAEVNNKNVVLNWQSSTNINKKGFKVERSIIINNTGVNKWETIGNVNGINHSTETGQYSFSDNVSEGTYLYRLKQVGFDGSINYSDNIEVEVTGPGNFALHQNYPNPFNPSTNIEYQLPADGFVTLTIYNSIGKEVSTLVNEYQSGGKHTVSFDSNSNGKELPSGLYFYSLRSGDHNVVKKMLLLK